MNRKVTVVGAGNVGATLAQRIADRELADVVLIDILEGMPQGKGLDMMEATPVEGSDARVIGTNDYKDTAGSDIVVITAGLARKPGMSRDDLLQANYKIVKACTENAAKHSPDSILIIVSNPLDAMCQVARRSIGCSAWPESSTRPECAPSSPWSSGSRWRTPTPSSWVATATRWFRSRATRRWPITELMAKERVDAIVQRTRKGGAEIVGLLKTSAYYAPSSAAAEMVDAVLKDKHKILPCCCYLEGEFGIRGLYGRPHPAGAKGVEKIGRSSSPKTRTPRSRSRPRP